LAAVDSLYESLVEVAGLVESQTDAFNIAVADLLLDDDLELLRRVVRRSVTCSGGEEGGASSCR
jgi:hypothetical protein